MVNSNFEMELTKVAQSAILLRVAMDFYKVASNTCIDDTNYDVTEWLGKVADKTISELSRDSAYTEEYIEDVYKVKDDVLAEIPDDELLSRIHLLSKIRLVGAQCMYGVISSCHCV